MVLITSSCSLSLSSPLHLCSRIGSTSRGLALGCSALTCFLSSLKFPKNGHPSCMHPLRLALRLDHSPPFDLPTAERADEVHGLVVLVEAVGVARACTAHVGPAALVVRRAEEENCVVGEFHADRASGVFPSGFNLYRFKGKCPSLHTSRERKMPCQATSQVHDDWSEK
ncbi:2-C-methyl-D-erythritol 4-phosphatecytidylyltransferase [Striga asiatica]|uniref:2-C-methyl-D-erythritol 4-phosphatecytidylyltransferase n=1 Tax=Striga asiatica TaxID=4170 RepID=A0A5A7P1T1_STRAF|nr:2-C-methyl-D-erythritol 4-phosphatecytidylyltransferase [Striga asiatica]